jgi:hypothetical protein
MPSLHHATVVLIMILSAGRHWEPEAAPVNGVTIGCPNRYCDGQVCREAWSAIASVTRFAR